VTKTSDCSSLTITVPSQVVSPHT